MYVKRKIKDKLPIIDYDNFYVVTDFDRTITKGNSKTSWSILASSDLVPKEYVKERQELYDYYRPIEIDEEMEISKKSKLVKEWFKKHIELFVKYQTSEEVFEKAAMDLRVMEFREGAKEFIYFLHEHNIPLIIISAGIGNFIESFLKHNDCYLDNIYISSNKIMFKDGIANGVDKNIIHSLNKNEVSLPSNIANKIKGRNNVMLLGDQVSDLNMVNEELHDTVYKIGFLTDESSKNEKVMKDSFDIVCGLDNNYFDLIDVIFKD